MNRAGALVAVLIMLAAGAPTARAESADSLREQTFARGVAAYEAGQVAEADTLFRSLVAGGLEHPDLLFNMGNCSYRRARWAEAVLAWEWALDLDPGDADARHNLELARSHLVADQVADEAPPLARTAADLMQRVSVQWTLLGAVAAWSVAWIALAGRFLRGAPAFTVAALIAAALSVVLGAHVALREADRRQGEKAIILRPEVQVSSGPGASYAALFELHAGTLVRVREERAGWLRIQLPRGPAGWMESRAAAIIGRPETFAPPAEAPPPD